MYSQESIDALETRIGWSDLSSDLPFELSEENKTADSGKTFNWYHSLLVFDNIYSSVPKVNMEEEDFNEYLSTIRKQAVISVLSSILDNHVDYDPAKDYSNIITNRPALFDDAIGYSVAIKMIELFISTSRSNGTERSAKMSYQTLKIELEGARNDNGHFVAKGLVYKHDQSIRKAQKIIFPVTRIVTSKPIW
jgi:hypothetical protein